MTGSSREPEPVHDPRAHPSVTLDGPARPRQPAGYSGVQTDREPAPWQWISDQLAAMHAAVGLLPADRRQHLADKIEQLRLGLSQLWTDCPPDIATWRTPR